MSSSSMRGDDRAREIVNGTDQAEVAREAVVVTTDASADGSAASVVAPSTYGSDEDAGEDARVDEAPPLNRPVAARALNMGGREGVPPAAPGVIDLTTTATRNAVIDLTEDGVQDTPRRRRQAQHGSLRDGGAATRRAARREEAAMTPRQQRRALRAAQTGAPQVGHRGQLTLYDEHGQPIVSFRI